MSVIAVIGAGYVGLTTGACLSSLGHVVTCVDNDVEKVDRLRAGSIPIHEPGLDELVKQGMRRGSLYFTTDASQAVEAAEFVFLCLPTPELPDGSADTSFVRAACLEIHSILQKNSIVIYKSTVPITSERRIEEWINRGDVHIASNPEFLREGSAVYDFLHPDRIVVGARDDLTRERVSSLYSSLSGTVVLTDCRSSETIKYLANAFLALKISFINETARFCQVIGADIDDVRVGLSLDPRIGDKHLTPGPGWGGSCFPKDTKALIHSAMEHGFDFHLVRNAVQSNETHQEELAALIVRHATIRSRHQNLVPVVGALGLSFKAGTDDLRKSPSLTILNLVRPYVGEIRAFDPLVRDSSGVVDVHCEGAIEAARGCDVIAVLTEWDHFRNLDPHALRSVMRGNVIVDARYILDRPLFRDAGFEVVAVGTR